MNIFEQYGIREVADVTLYAIELDENDEEIYIPVLYLYHILNRQVFYVDGIIIINQIPTN